MSCSFSRETLALHVEDDLPIADAEIASKHLSACEECREFFEQLCARQSLVKSLRRHTISRSECAGMRRGVMSVINNPRKVSGWALRIERALMLGVRKRVYAFAVAAVLVVVSASVLAQIRHGEPASADTLVRPDQYRDWILVGNAQQHGSGNVYISPSAYREYSKTGTFAEGTVMVLDAGPVVLASVKDRTRFAGGWGFFDFTGNDGNLKLTAQALPDSRGCRSCHEQRAETDHVFTQFYPRLKSI